MTGATILSGFLGSGKTTLVNRLLSRPAGPRYAVLVNEFGDVGIDGQLIVASEDEVVELANGCVCCTIRGDLERGLVDLLERRNRLLRKARFDGVLIEGSGLASPGPIAQTLAVVPALAEGYELNGIVTLAHAGRIAEQLEGFPEAREQVGLADWLVLNHTDGLEAAALNGARSALRKRNGAARLFETSHADLDLALLENELASLGLELGAHVEHSHQTDVVTASFSSDEALDIHRLKMWLQFLSSRPDGQILRIKGIVRCAGHTNALTVQGVYQLLEFGPSETQAPECSQLVVIGQDFDPTELERGWQACSSSAGL